MQLRRHDLLGVPGGVLGRQQPQGVFRLGEDLLHELSQPAIEAGAARAAGLGEHEAPLVDVAAQAGGGFGSQIEVLPTRQPEHRGLQHVVASSRRRVEDVPGESGGVVGPPARLDVLDEVGDVVAVAIPVVVRGVAALGHDHRPTALGEEEQGEARRDDRLLEPRRDELAGERVLFADEHPGSLEIPVGLADVAAGGESADPFEAVEVVVEPGLAARAGVLPHREPPAEPLQAALEHFGRGAASAAGDRLPPRLGVRRPDVLRRDPDARDAGAGHAAGAADVADGVAPGAVGVRAALPVLLGAGPGLVAHVHAGPGSLVEREQRELRVGVVADPGPLVLAVRPGSGRRALLHLRPFEPAHVALEDRPVGLGREQRECQGLQRDRVGGVGLLAAEPAEPALHRPLVGADTRVRKREHHEAGLADGLVVGRHGPRAVGPLLLEQPVAGPLDRPLNRLGAQRRPALLGRCQRKREHRGEHRQAGRQPPAEEACGSAVPVRESGVVHGHAEGFAARRHSGRSYHLWALRRSSRRNPRPRARGFAARVTTPDTGGRRRRTGARAGRALNARLGIRGRIAACPPHPARRRSTTSCRSSRSIAR